MAANTEYTDATGSVHVYTGDATLNATAATPNVGEVTVSSGFEVVYAATATFSEDPGSAASIYCSKSGGDVTFKAGNLDDIDIDFVITGRM